MLAGNTAFSPNAFESIATATGPGTSITLSSIPATYTHLQVRINWARNSGNSTINMQINGDTTAGNYTNTYMFATNTSLSATSDNSDDRIRNIGTAYGGPTARGSAVMEILNYRNTGMWKAVRTVSGGLSTSNSNATYATGLYMSTSAITSLTFTIGGDTFNSDTQIALYGIKGV
jgi:hypothetical protein